jgi:transglutaminase-like putative cysteine protease
MTSRNIIFWALVIALTAFPGYMLFYKLYIAKLPMESLIPDIIYQVQTQVDLEGYGNDVNVSVYLPKNDSRQQIFSEQSSNTNFTLTIPTDELNRQATWIGTTIEGAHNLRYSYSVKASHVQYKIPDNISIPKQYPARLDPYLMEEEGIQVNDDLIRETLFATLELPAQPKVLEALRAIHDHLQDNLENRDFSGYTDALTALKLGEASCNGKSRAFVAMARHLNIPARLVGGLILQTGSKRTSHQWVEVYIGGHWVPFDTINDHFAEIPANFLTLYYGDKALFTRSANINFDYSFRTNKSLVPRNEVSEILGDSLFNALNIYAVFERIGISQDFLKILLMLPLGAFVTVVFRNVLGLETFGTFLPALIAAATMETGLLWGLVGFVGIIISAAIVRKLLDWMQLLHSPKMAIMLTVVVILLLVASIAGVHFELFKLAQISLFPIAILAITAERFAITVEEQGLVKAFNITAMTVVVIIAAYTVMDSLFLQSLFFAFPELLLIVIVLNLWLGKWIGLRLSELIRFRQLIFSGKNP